ncbi:MAG: hypothetical protein OEW00_06290, partial [candidate division Zixibacteria bacterium]|nr:hypothetical protein [candidate division Zixibacteria bacterium]
MNRSLSRRRRRLVLPAAVAVMVMSAWSASAEDVQPGLWKKSLQVDLTTTQTSYSNSWVGGEAGSVNW